MKGAQWWKLCGQGGGLTWRLGLKVGEDAVTSRRTYLILLPRLASLTLPQEYPARPWKEGR